MKYIICNALLSIIISSSVYAQSFTLKSNDMGGNGTKKIEFNGFGCNGSNVSPQLSWSNPPKGTKSYAITVYDPVAPTGSGFWHWVVFDIPSSITELLSGAGTADGKLMPKGSIQSKTDFGANNFGGPCPPENHGIHQYIFTIHALKTDKLGLDANTNPALVGYYLWLNTIEKASVVMYYERKKP